MLSDFSDTSNNSEEVFTRYDEDDYHSDVSVTSSSQDFYPRILPNKLSADHCPSLDDCSIQSTMQHLQITDDLADDTATLLNNTVTLQTPKIRNHTEDDNSMYLPPLQDTHAHPIVDISSNDKIIEERAIEHSDTDEEQIRAIDGGYDYEFLRKFKKIEDDYLVCPICHLVCREPKQTKCCGMLFCDICITKLIRSKSKPSCPCCRSEPLEWFADKRSNRVILDFKVSCKRLKKGCKWQGTLQEAEKVERRTAYCDYQVIVCSNHCRKKIYRHKLKRHLEEFCPKRQIKCSLCKEHGEWTYITGEHKHVCPDELLNCHNKGCKETVKRRHFDNHLSVCPKKILCCTFADLGCKTTCIREKMQQHNDQFIHHHLTCAVNVARSPDVPKMDHLLQVAPVILKLHTVSESKHLKSQPFLSCKNGYKMCIVLNDFVEYCFCLMPGKYDDQIRLKWPFCGNITVTLLNQTNDSSHYEMKYFNMSRNKQQIIERVKDKEYGPAIKIANFRTAELTTLKQPLHILKERGYLVNDTVYLSVEYKR